MNNMHLAERDLAAYIKPNPDPRPCNCNKTPFYVLVIRYILDVLLTALCFGALAAFLIFFILSFYRSCYDIWWYLKIILGGMGIYLVGFLVFGFLYLALKQCNVPLTPPPCEAEPVGNCEPQTTVVKCIDRGSNTTRCPELERKPQVSQDPCMRRNSRGRALEESYQPTEERVERALGPLCPRMPGALGQGCRKKSPCAAPAQNSSRMSCCSHERQREQYNDIQNQSCRHYEQPQNQCCHHDEPPQNQCCHRDEPPQNQCFSREPPKNPCCCREPPKNPCCCREPPQRARSSSPRPWIPILESDSDSQGGSQQDRPCAVQNGRSRKIGNSPDPCFSRSRCGGPTPTRRSGCVTDDDEDDRNNNTQAQCIAQLEEADRARSYQYGPGGPNCRVRTQEKPTINQFFRVDDNIY